MRSRRGLTLIEVVVSAAILAILGMLVTRAYSLSATLTRRSDINELAYREANIGMAKLTNLLKGSTTDLKVSDGVVNQITVEVPKLDGRRIAIDSSGRAVTDRTLILRKRKGSLVGLRQDEKDDKILHDDQVLCRLGGGSVSFEMIQNRLLEVTMDCRLTGEQENKGTHKIVRRFYLGNS